MSKELINHFEINRICASTYLRKKAALSKCYICWQILINLLCSVCRVCPFVLFIYLFSLVISLCRLHFSFSTFPAPPLPLSLAAQTLNYTKDAEHSSSSPVSQIPLYNPQRNLLLCTRWIVFVAVFTRVGGGVLRFLRVVALD